MDHGSISNLAHLMRNRQFLMRVGLPILFGILIGLLSGFILWFLGSGFKL